MAQSATIASLWNQQPGREADRVVIAEAECAILPLTLWEVRALVRGGRIYWLVDNSPSLHALVKGSSANEAMEKAVALMYIMCRILNCSI